MDFRVVIGDKAYSWATKKKLPEPGKRPIILHEQPVHDAQYALTKEIIIPEGQYGAGRTYMEFAQKGKAEVDSTTYKLNLNNGTTYTIKKLPKLGEKAWLLMNTTKLEKKALDLNGLEVDRHKYKEPRTDHLEKVTDPIGSIKYDGAAYFVPVSEDGSLRFISRKPSVTGKLLDRTEKLPHLASIKLPQFAGHVLHVELIHTGKTKGAPESHPTVSGILNSLTPKALRDQAEKGPVRAVLLDVIHPSVPTFSEKLKILKDIETSAGKPSLFFTPKTTKGLENITKLLDSSRSKGHEGVIITSLTKPEDKNPRYKVKHVGTYNLRVEGIAREKDKHGNPKDSMGALDVYDKTGRHVARVGTGFSRELRKEIWENPYDWLYKLIQVKAMRPTAHKLRAPVYNGEADGEIDRI